MPRGALLWILLCACGPKLPGDPEPEDMTGGETSGPPTTTMDPPATSIDPSTTSTTTLPDPTTSTTTSTTTLPDPSTSTTAPPEIPTDEQLCADHCAQHAGIPACGPSSPTCVAECIDLLAYYDGEGCGLVVRTAWVCEHAHSLDVDCESSACAHEYLMEDLCHGFCTHYGAWPSGGSSPEQCDWNEEGCYGHDLTMVCSTGANSTCSCVVDGVEVSTCSLGMHLDQFCGGIDFHVFSGCCTAVFVDAIE